MAPLPPPDWHPDPTGRHQYRYWDGTRWTDWAADNGFQLVDPLALSPAPAVSARPGAALADGSARRTSEYWLIGSNAYPNTEVAGEFARMDSIHRAIGRKPKRDEEIVVESMTAELRPEPRNRFDSSAVMVVINGEHVGYLEKEVAAIYQPLLLRVTAAGHTPVTSARVWAAAREDWDSKRKTRYSANVRVALNEPHLLLPANEPPEGQHSLIPWGNGLQVTGEEDHQERLAAYLSGGSDVILLGTLAVIEVTAARSARTVVEVRIDGQRVGQLTPASSQHFVPTVQHLSARGVEAVAWLRVKGNPIAAQVTLQATKAHELPAAWLAAPASVPRLTRR